MNTTATHALFERYPLDEDVVLTTGIAPSPYHVYDGFALFVGGSADLEAVRELMESEEVHPLRTDDGQALMGVWICDFTSASLGPHQELQVSLMTTEDPDAPPVPAHDFALLNAMVNRPDVSMLCHGLWNDEPRVVAYNRERLALDARRVDSEIVRTRDAVDFEFRCPRTAIAVVDGRIVHPRKSSLRASMGLLAHLGLRRVLALSREPWMRIPVTNPVGNGLARNAIAESFTSAAATSLRYFDPRRDRLELGPARYRRLRFRPRFVQCLEAFKFVYLDPR